MRYCKILACTAITAVAIGMALVVFVANRFAQKVADSADDLECKGRISQLAYALELYRSKFGCYPPIYTTDAKGERMHSWRVLVLPFVEGTQIYDNYDFLKPWHASENVAVAQAMTYQAANPFSYPGRRGEPPVARFGAALYRGSPWDMPPKLTGASNKDRLLLIEFHAPQDLWTTPNDIDALAFVRAHCCGDRPLHLATIAGNVDVINPNTLSDFGLPTVSTDARVDTLDSLLSALERCLKSVSVYDRHGAVMILGEIKGQRSTEILRSAAADSNERVRSAGEFALSKRG